MSTASPACMYTQVHKFQHKHDFEMLEKLAMGINNNLEKNAYTCNKNYVC